ncbi:MAG: tetratricopeptide repeat protein [Sulfuritalea sp.]|nr:tetratricopeptide repeat protein [Sulfuritalea sp.]
MTNIEPSPQSAAVSIEQSLQHALEHHRAGRLEEAVALYQAILQVDPGHAEANHSMGVLAVQVEQPAAGMPYFVAALEADPHRARYWLSYIDAMFRSGQEDEARDVLAQARRQGLEGDEVEALVQRLEADRPQPQVPAPDQATAVRLELPESPQVTPGLRKKVKSPKAAGNAASPGARVPERKAIDGLLAAFQQGRLTEAAALAQAMTRKHPRHEFGWKALGAIFQQMGRAADAVAPMQKAVELSGRDTEALYNLGVVFQSLGRLEEAEASYRRVLRLNPDYADAHGNLGVILHALGLLNDAEASLRHALQIKPDSAAGHGNLGLTLQHLGRLDEAAVSFRRALQISPDLADAHNNLGNTLKELGRPDEAEACYRRALNINPDFADAYNNLGIVLEDLGRSVEAEASYRMAFEVKPDFAAAYNNLGHALKEAGRLFEAEALLRSALSINPDYADAHCNLGATLMALTRPEEAEASYRRALEASPDFVYGHSNLGIALQAMGRLDEAAACFQKALELAPDFVETHINLGNTLKELGRPDAAEASYRQAIQISPDSAEAHYNLGIALKERGLPEEAETSYRRALEINPDYAEVHNNLGICLMEQGRQDEAETSYRRALEIKPDCADAHNNLGTICMNQGRLDMAETCYHRAIQGDPDFSQAHNNLGTLLMNMGRLDLAEASYRRAIQANPEYSEAYSNLGAVQKHLGQLDESMASCRRALELDADCAGAHVNLGNVLLELWQFDEAMTSYRRALEVKPEFAAAHSNLLFSFSQCEAVDAQRLFAEHCRFGEQFETNLRADWPQHSNPRISERDLHVGFVSADLRDHAVAYFIEPVLAHLATYPQLTLHAFHNHAIGDIITQRMRTHLKHWHPIAGLSDEAVAQKIRDEKIDILIDLSGHTSGNRLLTFARKPAPIQASWMGYPGTTGLQAMDYYFTDRFFLPQARFGGQFTEALVYLPANAPFLPYEQAPAVNGLPALENGRLTFGSFNRPSKITRPVVALWAKLLRALPESRMLLAGMPAAGKGDMLVEWFAQEGIERGRLSVHVRTNMDRYLGLHHQVDICLDTFPYNGGTTTLHALWMGVPTLTLAGGTPASRTGASVLGHVGLEAFVAHDAEDFVQKGLSLTGNIVALHDIRTCLRERLANSAIGQPALIAAGLNQALRIMWERWCRGAPAEYFEVTGSATADLSPESGK